MLARQHEQRELRTTVFHILIDYELVQCHRNGRGKRPTCLIP